MSLQLPVLNLPPIYMRARLMKQFQAFSRAGDVVRFHTRPQLQPQNVAAHSYGVVWLCWLLSDEKPRVELLFAALTHDAPEFVTGDLPGPVKSKVGGNALATLEADVLEEARLPQYELTEDEERVLKLADLLEGMRHCVKERQLGNQLMDSCYKRYHDGARALCQRDIDNYLWHYIAVQWEKADHGA